MEKGKEKNMIFKMNYKNDLYDKQLIINIKKWENKIYLFIKIN